MKYVLLLLLGGLLIGGLGCGPTDVGEERDLGNSAETGGQEDVGNLAGERAATDGEWTYLWDGTSTAAWRSYNGAGFPERGWRTEGEELIVEYSGTEEDGYGGDLITREQFGDFELELEFKLSDTSNSGILYLVREVAGTPIWHNAPEYQLLDDSTYLRDYAGLTDKQLTGANYDMHAQPANYSRPIGEWNRARITKRGNHVEHWLNDNLVVAYDLYSPDWEARYAASKFADYPDYARADRGHIGLQDHGHRVSFRNIRIR